MQSPAAQNAPVAYPPGTILTTAQLAAWLQCSERQVELLRLPRLSGLGRLARYEAGAVLQHLMADHIGGTPFDLGAI